MMTLLGPPVTRDRHCGRHGARDRVAHRVRLSQDRAAIRTVAPPTGLRASGARLRSRAVSHGAWSNKTYAYAGAQVTTIPAEATGGHPALFELTLGYFEPR